MRPCSKSASWNTAAVFLKKNSYYNSYTWLNITKELGFK